MFGDVGFRIQDGVGPNAEKTVAQVFTRGGKMVNDKRQEPQNTTVSSIIVLDTYPLRQKRIDAAIKLRERELGRSARVEEKLALYEAIPDTSDLRRVRLMVHENPFARIPLRRDVFDGPFDERWGGDGECIRRVYVGSIAARFADALGES